jgi:NitT/TauT family transport system substrate-binding protein
MESRELERLMRAASDRRRFLKGAFLLGAGAASLAVVGCGGDDDEGVTTTGTPTPARVRLISWSTPRTEQANIFAAQELGYFREQSIEYEYVPGMGSGDSLKQLLAGNGEISFAGPEGIFLAVDEGADVIAVYNTYPQNIFVLVAKRETGITKVSDFKGKKIGVLSLASGGRYNTNTVLEANGLKESDVTLVATGPAPTAFLQNQVDVWMTLTTTTRTLEAQGLQLNKFPVADYANLPTDVFAMLRRDYEDRAKRDVIKRFLRAIRKGTDLMINQPQQAAQIGAKYGLDITDPNAALPVIQEFARASQSEGTKKNGLGWFDIDVIQQGADLYFKQGLIKKQFDAKKYFTNDLVKEL